VSGTVSTAEHVGAGLDSMSDDAAPAMRAAGCQLMNGAFEAVEHMRSSLCSNFEALVVVVSAHFTSGHITPRSQGLQPGCLNTDGAGCWVLGSGFYERQSLFIAQC